MDEIRLKAVLPGPFEDPGGRRSVTQDSLSDFKKVLTQSMDDMNRQLTQADQQIQEMILGKRDIHQTMIVLEQANLSLRLMIQVRNKLLAAYEELIRMQI